jgi:carboxylesterase type B
MIANPYLAAFATWLIWSAVAERGPGEGKMSVVVSTALGKISGKRDGNVNSFLGIPFAEPPTGTFRFRPPRQKRAWAPSTYQAHSYSPECLQSSLYATVDGDGIAKDEDCLYLNIWTPANAKPSSNKEGLLPVLLWIYGGAFIHGGASKPEYVGDQLASRGVVVVSCNYRLGSLGFLVSTSDGLFGNYGLADQKMAMMWVQDHIRNFGGDPQRVTLFGESAGAMSIGLHFLDQQYQQQRLMRVNPGAPRNWLFHAIVLQSNPLGYKYRAVSVANFLGAAYKDRLDCEDLRCLQSESADELIHVQDTLMAVPRSIGDFFTWGPVVTDQHYWREYRLRPGPESNITVRQPIEAMRDLLRLGKKLDVPVVMGTTKDEGRVFVFTAFRTHMPKIVYQAVVVSFFRGSALRVLKQYAALSERESESPYPDFRTVLSTIIGDYLFRCPNQLFASQLTAANTSVFLYEFSLPTRTPGYPCCDGLACHTAELPYVFNQIKVIDDDYSWRGDGGFSAVLSDTWSSEAMAGGSGSGGSGSGSGFAFPDIFGAASSWFGGSPGGSGGRSDGAESRPRILVDSNVSNTMADYWTTFATYGDPNGLPSPPNGYDGSTRPQGAPLWPTLLGDLAKAQWDRQGDAGNYVDNGSADEFDEYVNPKDGGVSSSQQLWDSAVAAKRQKHRRMQKNDREDEDEEEEEEDDEEDLVTETTVGGDGTNQQAVRVRRMRPTKTKFRYSPPPTEASTASQQWLQNTKGSFLESLTRRRRNIDKAAMHIVRFDDPMEVVLLENDCACMMWHTLGYPF